MENINFHWLVGLLEGEGCFMKGSPSSPNCPSVNVQMTDEDVIKRAANYIHRGNYFKTKPQKTHHKEAFMVRVRGKRAVALMRRLLPFMGERRGQQIRRALASYEEPPPPKVSSRDVVEIKRRFKEETAKQVAKDFDISHWTVYDIVRGKSYNFS